MLNKYEQEVFSCGGQVMLDLAHKEFLKGFEIIARTPEYIVLGDKDKNVKIAREGKIRVLERFVFDKTRNLERKR